MRRPAEHACLGLAAVLAVVARAPAQDAGQVTTFRTGDGSHFVLLPDGGPPVCHWTVATPAGPLEDPPGFDGLAVACARASLRGTWHIGSRDATAEPAALLALDQALADLSAASRTDGHEPAALQQAVERARTAAAALADPQAFLRVLAAAPALDVEVSDLQSATVLRCTTDLPALQRVAELLVERREQPALRGLHEEFAAVRTLLAAPWRSDPLQPLRAEALALAFPGQALARAADRPGASRPDQTMAAGVWRRTQRPDRSIHVLVGGFAVAPVRAILERAFALTALPNQPLPPPAPPRTATASRRSTVPGLAQPACVLGFHLAGDEDPNSLATALRWLASGTDGWLLRELPQAGILGATAVATLPWPLPGAPQLLVLEVRGGSVPNERLADTVLRLCAGNTMPVPTATELAPIHAALVAKWEYDSRDGRQFATLLAVQALLRPEQALPIAPPAPASPAAVATLLQTVLRDPAPIVVECKLP
ncbi:MAG TPA: hypothetical protein VK348_07550 [Planctomycetota bacterium]|nr:hypothetical protein [Planctomycetota bacterium]